MVATEGPETFVFEPAAGLPLNMTLTQAPVVKDGLIDLNWNGRFIQELDSPIDALPPRLDNSNSEQFWVHEDTLNSYI